VCCFYAESRNITIEFLQHLLKTNIMKKVFSIIALSAMTLSLSSFTNQDLLIFEAPTCFEGARALVIMTDGEINLSNHRRVLAYTRACEAGELTFN
jgi:hypothetical protein